jgi:O-antigen/teichoic acid export membrane protein
MTATRTAIIWASSGKLLSFTLAFATSIIIARYYLGPAEVGLFSIAFAATALIAVLQEFGLNRYIVGAVDLGVDGIRTAFSVSLTVAWGVALLILMLAWPVSRLYGDPQLLPLMLVIGSSYLLVPLAIVPTALLHRRMDFRSDFMIETGAAATNAGVSLTLAAMGWGAMALAWGAFGQQVARASIAQWRNGFMLPWPPRFTDAAPVLRFGSGSTLLQIFDSVGARAPDLIVGGIAGNVAVGLYSRGAGLAVQVTFLLTGAVNSVFYPAFARLRDQGQPLGDAYVRMVAGYSGVVFAAMAGLACAAYPLVMALYGPRWIGVAPILSVLALAQIVLVMLPMAVQIPILFGRLSAVVWRSGIATLTGMAMMVAGASTGVEVAALAYVGYVVTIVALNTPLLAQLTGFSWTAMIRTWLLSLACALAACAPMLIAYRYWVPPQTMTFWPLLLLVGLGIIAWLAALTLFRHPLAQEVRGVASSMHGRLRAARG